VDVVHLPIYVCEKTPCVACQTKPRGFGRKRVEEVAGDLSIVNLSEVGVKVEVAEGVGVPLDDGEGHSIYRAGSLDPTESGCKVRPPCSLDFGWKETKHKKCDCHHFF